MLTEEFPILRFARLSPETLYHRVGRHWIGLAIIFLRRSFLPAVPELLNLCGGFRVKPSRVHRTSNIPQWSRESEGEASGQQRDETLTRSHYCAQSCDDRIRPRIASLEKAMFSMYLVDSCPTSSLVDRISPQSPRRTESSSTVSECQNVRTHQGVSTMLPPLWKQGAADRDLISHPVSLFVPRCKKYMYILYCTKDSIILRMYRVIRK